jgi:hypothetical protein
MRAWRIGLAVAGILVGLYGVGRLLVGAGFVNLLILAGWLIGAVILHDAVLAPAVVAVGWTLGRLVKPRARRWLQAFLIASGLVTVIAIWLIARRGTQEPAKAILQQDYLANLTLLLGLIAGVSLLGYLVQVAGDRRRFDRRPKDQLTPPP